MERQLPPRLAVAFVALLALAFLGIGMSGISDTIALRKSDKVTEAYIIESRDVVSVFGISHEVRYSFEEAPTSMAFLGRNNLWSRLPDAEWRKAIETRRLSVKYDPSNLENNAPIADLPSILDHGISIMLGLFLLACIVLIEIKRRRAASISTREDGPRLQNEKVGQVGAPNDR